MKFQFGYQLKQLKLVGESLTVFAKVNGWVEKNIDKLYADPDINKKFSEVGQ